MVRVLWKSGAWRCELADNHLRLLKGDQPMVVRELEHRQDPEPLAQLWRDAINSIGRHSC